jgi:hypothetical protein
MTDIYNEEYWSSQFDITQEDLNRVADRLEAESAPQDLKAIALPIITRRLQRGHDMSGAVLGELTGRPSVRLWDPAGEWQVGDLVLLATTRKGNTEREAFVGQVVIANYRRNEWEIDRRARIRIDELSDEKDFVLALGGSREAANWHEAVREAVERKFQSGDISQQAEGVLMKHGERILSRLTGALQSDSRFTGIEGKWYASKKVPRLTGKTMQAIHHSLVQEPSASLDELVAMVKKEVEADDSLLRMALQTALQQTPERFENIGTPAQPQWQALLPTPQQALVTHFAYDPETYEILCRPGQRVTQKQALRLQQLDLYAHVVTFAV